MQNWDSGELLLEFSTEESLSIEKEAEELINDNPQYKEKYFVDGIGYFVLTDFESCKFCHIDIYILIGACEGMSLVAFLDDVINQIDDKIKQNKTKDELLLAKYFDGEYSKFGFKNKNAFFYRKKGIIYIDYSIGIDTINHSKDDIINLGFSLSKKLKNIFNEVIKSKINRDEFILYFYNLVIKQLDFLKKYYEELILDMDDKQLNQQVYFFNKEDSKNKKKINYEESPF